MSKYTIYQDTDRCIGCFSCEAHCKTKNQLPAGPRLCQIIPVGPRLVNGLPRMANIFIPCFHCENPWCVAACPTGAMQKREKDGIVFVDPSLCIGCKSCIMACPWGTPQWNPETGKAVKCDYCMDRVDQGLEPACVAKCITKCLHFGEPSLKTKKTRERFAREVSGLYAPDPGRSTLPYLGAEYVENIRDKRVSTGICGMLSPPACRKACPAGIDVPSYVALISRGRYEEAVDVIREDNPFPWVCGLVCPAACEAACRRGTMDEPVSIRALKAFASKQAMEKPSERKVRRKERRDERIAVVGSGPAGLTAAYYLAMEGYDVTVFEALPEAGGMLRVGIPPHRLPKELLDREIDQIRALGVTIKTDAPIGPQLSVDDLFEQGFQAVFLGVGAHRPLPLGIAGENTQGVMQGIDYLRKLNLGEPLPEAKKVIVVGGGNVAMDVARSAIRKGAEDVHVVYRRTRREMPAYDVEIEEALEEGVSISYLCAPAAVLSDNGRLTGLRCIKMELGEPDASGRRRPVPVLGSEYDLEADLVLLAIGQALESGPFEEVEGLGFTRRGTFLVAYDTLSTGRKGVFAGGDAVTGPATAVEAIAAGKRAARAIDAYIKGVELKIPSILLPRRRVEWCEVNGKKVVPLRRPKIPMLEIEKRKHTFEQAELGLTEEMAVGEAKRCIRCDLMR